MSDPATINAAMRSRVCASCGAPALLAIDACPYCAAAIGWPREPLLDRGERIAAAHCPNDVLPGETKRRATDARGAHVDLDTDRWNWGEIGPELVEGCIAITATTLDANGWFGALVRARRYGETRAGYLVDLHPGTRALRIAKQVWGKVTSNERLSGWRASSAVHAPGQPNELEVRFAGPTLQVFANGVHALTATDDTFGYGHAMWHADASTAGPSSIVIARVELFHVR